MYAIFFQSLEKDKQESIHTKMDAVSDDPQEVHGHLDDEEVIQNLNKFESFRIFLLVTRARLLNAGQHMCTW